MSIAANFLLSILYNIIVLAIPLVTVPYVSRVLGADGIGVYAFSDSLVRYFAFFGALGSSLYGSRLIAYVRDDVSRRSQAFWEISCARGILSCISTIGYLLFINTTKVPHPFISNLQTVVLFSVMVDISWFFTGLEEFRITIVRSLAVKAVSLAVIFSVVRSPEDTWKYTLTLALSEFLGQLVLWFRIGSYVHRSTVTLKGILVHLGPTLRLFVPQLTAYVYMYVDKTMLGYLTTNAAVGIYALAEKIVRMPLTLVTALGTVVLPRISNLIAKNDLESAKSYVTRSFRFSNFLAFGALMGVIGVSPELVGWYLGEGFSGVSAAIVALSPIMLVIPWGQVVGVQLMIPMGREMQVSIAPLCGAVVNIVLNVILIPRLLVIGASLASVAAELVGTCITLWLARDLVPVGLLFSESWKYVIASIAMFLVIRLLGVHLGAHFLTTVVQVMAGFVVYTGVLALLRSTINRYVFTQILRRIGGIRGAERSV